MVLPKLKPLKCLVTLQHLDENHYFKDGAPLYLQEGFALWDASLFNDMLDRKPNDENGICSWFEYSNKPLAFLVDLNSGNVSGQKSSIGRVACWVGQNIFTVLVPA